MAFIDYTERIIRAKIVYWGPHGSGKTQNLNYVWERTNAGAKGVAYGSPTTEGNFDFLPIKLGDIRGFQTQFELYTVPGGDGFSGARRALLESVDGIVFVGDSRRGRARHNAQSFSELVEGLASWGMAFSKLPLVLQCNLSDAPDAASPAEVAAPLLSVHPHPTQVPVVVACATRGEGVFDALKAVSRLVLLELRRPG